MILKKENPESVRRIEIVEVRKFPETKIMNNI